MRSSLFCAYFSRFSSEVCYYNLSPQGDGNYPDRLCTPMGADYNLSPQGDGNFCVPTQKRHNVLQLIPARGRKPATPTTVATDRPNYNLSPQGDGNLRCLLKFAVFLHYNLSPQGDGNLLMCSRTRAEINYNSSPQGDGNPSDSILHTMNGSLQLIPVRGQKSPSAAGTNQCGGALLFRFFCFRVSGRAFRRGWPRQREFPRCPAGRSASRGGSHADRR